MQIEVLLFAAARDAAACDSISIDVVPFQTGAQFNRHDLSILDNILYDCIILLEDHILVHHGKGLEQEIDDFEHIEVTEVPRV